MCVFQHVFILRVCDCCVCVCEFYLFLFAPAGSVTSVHSQPCDSRALLQVPDVSPVRPRPPLNLTPPRIAPPASSPSPRSLRRQVRDPVLMGFL